MLVLWHAIGNPPLLGHQRMIIGIDPGLNGAVAFCEDSGALVNVLDLPIVAIGTKDRLDVRHFRAMVEMFGAPDAIVYLENVSAMPKQGAGPSFNFGRMFGELHGVLIGMEFVVRLVTPQKWMFAMGLRSIPGAVKKDRKNASRARACQLFSNHTHHFARVKDDGRAEAALIAHYGALQEMKP